MRQNNLNNQEKTYNRIYLTEFKREMEKHGIAEDVESFLKKAFYAYLDERTKEVSSE